MTASKLVRPDSDYKASFLEALKEYHAEGRYDFLSVNDLHTDFEPYVKALNSDRGTPHQPLQEWVVPVPETVAWLVKDDKYLGAVTIRHRLNWHLEKWGGHLHFIIRPSMRGKGFGRKILLKALPIANYLGIDKALVTLDPNNLAGRRVVESCGGKLEDEISATDQFPARVRYWIDCT